MIALALAQPDKRYWSRHDIVNDPDSPDCYEIIEGDLFLPPSPGFAHQDIVGNLLFELQTYAREHDAGFVLTAPLDVIIDEHQSVQPDIIFIAKERKEIIKTWIEGPPDLVVEVASPSTSARDRVLKSRVYAKFGVRHYWIIDPIGKSLEAFKLAGEHYTLIGSAADGEEFEPELFPGLTIELTKIWPEP